MLKASLRPKLSLKCKLSPCSRENTEKELLWLLCADNFQRQLRSTYPHTHPLLLTPR